MKLTCRRESLLAACQVAAMAASAREVKPVLRNLKAIADDDALTVIATDMEYGVRIEVRGLKIEEPGEALWHAARFSAILRECTDEEVFVGTNKERCLIQGVANEFELPVEDVASFPDVPEFSGESYHEINAGVLQSMIRRTAFACATAESTKFGATTGLLFDLNGNNASLVATDGRRLACTVGEAESVNGHATSKTTSVVPPKAVGLLEKNLTDPDEMVKVLFSPNEVLFKTERATVYSRLVEGRYPDYQKIIPPKFAKKAVLGVGAFQAAIRQAAIMTDDESKRVVFRFGADINSGKGVLNLQAQGASSGKSKVEIPVEMAGGSIEISFDPKFILDFLRVLPGDGVVSFEMNEPDRPVLLRAGEDYRYIVVPLVNPGEKK